MGSGFDKDHRQSNHVLYSLDATKQRALWISFDARPTNGQSNSWQKTERAPLADPFPWAEGPICKRLLRLSQCGLRKRKCWKMSPTNGVRRLRLHLASPRGAERMSVQIKSEILGAAVDGKRLDSNQAPGEPQKNWSLSYFAVPKEGIELALETKSTQPVAVQVVDESYGLPLLDGTTFMVRPAHMMPAPYFRSDFTVVSQAFSF